MNSGDRSATAFQEASPLDEVRLLATELRSRWRAGERVCVESLGERFELLSRDDDRLLDLLYHELLIREEYGDQPTVDEYIERFPQLTEQLQRQFEVHSAVDHDWTGDGFEPDSAMLDDSDFGATLNGEFASHRRKRLPVEVSAPPGYELLEEIGRGGMAVVFKARQTNLNRLVALKMILAGPLAGEQVLARLQQEAKAIAQLQHAGIVQIHEVGEHQGLPFLSLEYVPGGTLQQWLNGRPLPIETAAWLIESLARTMHFAHERGVIHRDLKPANVLLTSTPDSRTPHSTLKLSDSATDSGISTLLPPPKISDFGLARLLDGDSELTTTGQVIGTPSYMAPEQAGQGNVSASPAPDIYSLGAILYEALTGRPPFQGATILQTLEQVQNQEPVPPRQLQPRIPADLETICLKCLEKSPTRRYPTALELADDLGRFLRNESITARPSGWIERGRKWIRRRPAVAALLALIAVLTVGGWTAILREMRRANEAVVRANHSEADARRDSAQANEQRRIADLERQNARDAQARAEANFLKAIDVVRRFSDVGEQLRYEPKQQRTSGLLFETALEFFENVLVERADDPTVRFQAAAAFLRAGEIRMTLGQHDKAAKQFDRAVELLESGAASANSLPSLRELATVLRLQGNNLRQLDRRNEAETAYRRSIETNASLATRLPEEVFPLVHQANVRVNLCVILCSTGREDEALVEYQRAVETLRQSLLRQPDSAWCKSELALCLDDFGNQLWSRGQSAAAKPLLQEAFDVRRALLDAEPRSRDYSILMARSLRSLARCDEAADDLEQAAKRLEEAESLLLIVVDQFPDQSDVCLEALSAVRDRIHLEKRRNLPAPERSLALELGLLGKQMQDTPDDACLVQQTAEASQRLADLFWERKFQTEARTQYTFALKLFQKAMDLTGEDATLLARSAWLRAVCPATELRDFPRAVQQARRAVALDANNIAAWQALGAAELRNEDFAAAETALRKAIELTEASTPEHLESRSLLALTLFHQSRSADAELELAELTKRLPTKSPTHQFTRLMTETREALSKPATPSNAP